MAGIQISSVLLIIVIFSCLSFNSEARDHLVGGKSDAWKIPSSESDSLNHWAQKSRFLIGDSLVWEYDSSKDSVLQVSKRDYVTCNTSSPIETYTGGNTTVRLDHSGPYYFISGAKGHCEKGQKMIVVVMSEKHRLKAASPAPSPAEESGGPVAAPPPASDGGVLRGGFLVVALGAILVVM